MYRSYPIHENGALAVEQAAPPTPRDFVMVGRIGDRAITAVGISHGPDRWRQSRFTAVDIKADEPSNVHQALINVDDQGFKWPVLYAVPDEVEGGMAAVTNGHYMKGMMNHVSIGWRVHERHHDFRRWAGLEAPLSRGERSDMYALASWSSGVIVADLVSGGNRRSNGRSDPAEGTVFANRRFTSKNSSQSIGQFSDGSPFPGQVLTESNKENARNFGRLLGDLGGVVLLNSLDVTGSNRTMSWHVASTLDEVESPLAQAVEA